MRCPKTDNPFPAKVINSTETKQRINYDLLLVEALGVLDKWAC